MSKKILSLAVAVVMLISMFAFSASAANTTVETAFPADGQGGYRVVTDAYVGMPAGETVTVKVYYVLPDGADYSSVSINWTGNTVLGFTDAFTYDSGSRTWGDAYWFNKAGANVNEAAYAAASKQFNAADNAKGWTQAILVQKTLDTGAGSGLTSTTGHPVDRFCELYTVTFTTTRTLTATDTIGIPEGCAGKMVAYRYIGSAALTATNIILSEAANVAPLVVANSDTATAKMRPGEAAGTVDLGITGTVNALSFAAGKDFVGGCFVAPNLANIGVQARVNGVVAAAESTCIYETEDGFNYRAAITGIDAAGLDDQIEVRTYITDVNGNTYFSNWMAIDAVTVHDNAVGNGMTGIA
ncbi:MAG: hypothetical protein UGF89_12825 [Acutalibacteraceae bacterium]|nr:hypothetical protein [Acutalibacteraceae bacterium]